jgi:3-oxoadipate enol-lactonase
VPVLASNGIDIHYEIAGDGSETVVLINGVSDDLSAWLFQEPALVRAGYRVLAFDNRGVGRSSMPAGAYASPMMAADLRGLIAALGIDRPHLLGVSMGGVIAQEYAIKYGGLASLILANTYAEAGPYCRRIFRAWADVATGAGMPALMRVISPWIFSARFVEEEEALLAAWEADMAKTPQPAEAFASQIQVLLSHDSRDRLGQIGTRTLVLAAESDIVIPPELSRRLLEGLPNASWVVVPGGHGTMWETADEFNQAVLNFLRAS